MVIPMDNPQPRSVSEIFSRLAEGKPSAQTETRLATGAFLREKEEVALFRDVSGDFGIAIPATRDEFDRIQVDRRGLTIELTRAVASSRPELRLTLRDSSQLELFSVFVEEVNSYLLQQPSSPVAGVIRLYNRWKRLFADVALPQPISINEEIGLLCELEVLAELLNRGESPTCWTGPHFDRHDFKLPNQSIECKATTSGSGLRVAVHGSQQLTPLPGLPLVLAVRQYEIAPSGDISIPRLTRLILDIPFPDQDLFLAQLRKFNLDVNSILRSPEKFRTYRAIGAFEFDVIEDFPRIREVDIVSRVQNVDYVLDLSEPATVPGLRDSNEFFD